MRFYCINITWFCSSFTNIYDVTELIYCLHKKHNQNPLVWTFVSLVLFAFFPGRNSWNTGDLWILFAFFFEFKFSLTLVWLRTMSGFPLNKQGLIFSIALAFRRVLGNQPTFTELNRTEHQKLDKSTTLLQAKAIQDLNFNKKRISCKLLSV